MCGSMYCMIHLNTKLHMPGSSGSLLIAIKSKNKCRFLVVTIFFPCILKKIIPKQSSLRIIFWIFIVSVAHTSVIITTAKRRFRKQKIKLKSGLSYSLMMLKDHPLWDFLFSQRWVRRWLSFECCAVKYRRNLPKFQRCYVGQFLRDYTAQYPRRQKSSNHPLVQSYLGERGKHTDTRAHMMIQQACLSLHNKYVRRNSAESM
jgi:hypothetical protein